MSLHNKEIRFSTPLLGTVYFWGVCVCWIFSKRHIFVYVNGRVDVECPLGALCNTVLPQILYEIINGLKKVPKNATTKTVQRYLDPTSRLYNMDGNLLLEPGWRYWHDCLQDKSVDGMIVFKIRPLLTWLTSRYDLCWHDCLQDTTFADMIVSKIRPLLTWLSSRYDLCWHDCLQDTTFADMIVFMMRLCWHDCLQETTLADMIVFKIRPLLTWLSSRYVRCWHDCLQ